MEFISDTLNSLIVMHNLDARVFIFVYFVSFIPFYLGYFLLIYGTARKLKWSDVHSLNFKGKFTWNSTALSGVYVHLFGRMMPYAYIVFFGSNLPIYIYILVFLILLISIFFFFRRLRISKIRSDMSSVDIKLDFVVSDITEMNRLWEIYGETFEPVNKITPCKQSLDKEHFFSVLKSTSVRKYLLKPPEGFIIGIGLVTNDFSNTPWISEDYFQENYPVECGKKLAFYFMGLAIDKNFRGRRYSISLIEHIIDDLPEGAIMGFDHSKNVNPLLHHFTRIVKQARIIERRRIDSQHYHVVQHRK